MPCRSDYMEPTPQERYNQNTANLLLAFRKFLNKDCGDGLVFQAGNIYCSVDLTEALCSLIKSNKSKYNRFIGSDHSLAAELHLWWVNHQKVDEKRIAKEQKFVRMRELAEQAMKKLTQEELEALLDYARTNQ